jgi:WD40 repeat protein
VPDNDYHFCVAGAFDPKSIGDHAKIDAAVTVGDKSSAAAVWLDRVFLVPFRDRPYHAIQRQELLALSPDGNRLWAAVDADNVVSWNLPDLRLATEWSDFVSSKILGFARIDSLAAGTKWVVAGNERGETMLLSADKGDKVASWFGGAGGVRAVALHPSETLAAVGTQKGALRLLSIPTGDVVAELPKHAESVEAITFSRDGNFLVTGSLDQTVRLWKKAGGKYEMVLSLKMPTGRIASVRLSADNATLAVLAEPERAVRIWHLEKLKERLHAQGLGW